MTPDRCEVDTGDQWEHTTCRQPATYQARPPRGPEEVAMCSHHAWHAISDGVEVVDLATGNTCRIHDDGDIHQVST